MMKPTSPGLSRTRGIRDIRFENGLPTANSSEESTLTAPKMILALLGILLGFPEANVARTCKGMDWSAAAVDEKPGVLYKNTTGNTLPRERILADNGINTVRQRAWTTPGDGNYSLDYYIALASRAAAAGVGVYIDLHYGDTQAGPRGFTMRIWAHRVLAALCFRSRDKRSGARPSFSSLRGDISMA
ncbi:glycoside hydrolase family 53 protein [Trichocladium antarcticum]|uniref:Arabinogalactan endo-beta-1,4-galactanase n=1 Tax=Trichocladium antarcticum TaxID=1450529 RepID=A0AAN6UF40_9PEZI|nr:glycoside hydrolase family 53 protein [Trichocladium antarcticum]